MGLDMYLNAKRYVWHNEEELADKIGENVPGKGDMRVKSVTCEAGYWRKANAIHKWFVDNVQDGTDDCRNYYVSRAKLEELLNTVDKVLEKMELANELLPTQSGFFFGNTDYDDWYKSDLILTKEICEKALSIDDTSWEFEYHSSW